MAPDDARLRDVAAGVAELARPFDDTHASAAYRTELAQLMAVEALRAAWARTEERRAA